jgi:predicted protein tyrosine phosphatase
MRRTITDRLSFGDESSCTHVQDGSIAVVHACKDPCHRKSVGYTMRSIPNTHPHYLVLEKGHHLYLNLIDPTAPMFMLESFVAFLSFTDRQIVDRPLHIHCNQGESRAPSLTLLFMAKRLGTLPTDSYNSATAAFRSQHPYNPGRGIQTWLNSNWHLVK